MADEDEDKGWLQRRGGYPGGRGSFPKMYTNYRGKNNVSTAFKTESIRVPEAEAEAAYEQYMRQYPPPGYATECISQTANLDGTMTYVFRRYPTAE